MIFDRLKRLLKSLDAGLKEGVISGAGAGEKALFLRAMEGRLVYPRSKNACLQEHFCDTGKGLIPCSSAAEPVSQNQKFGEMGSGLALGVNTIYLCPDFITAGKVKMGLEALDLKASILSFGGEVGGGNRDLIPLFSQLYKFIDGELDVLILLPHVAITPIPKNLDKNFIEVKASAEIDADFIAKLVSFGYERVSMVTSAGEFAVRGDIIDIYLINQTRPIRIDLFDNFIEKINYFNLETMKSEESLSQLKVYSFSGNGETCSVLDYSDRIVIDEEKRIADEINLLKQSQEAENFFLKTEYITSRPAVRFEFGGGFAVRSVGQFNYVNDYKALLGTIRQNISGGIKTILFLGDEPKRGRMAEFLTENAVGYSNFEESNNAMVQISAEYFPLSASFLEDRVVIIGTNDLIKQKSSAGRTGRGEAFYLPKVGDHVVHSFHGIGKCIGIERLKMSDYEKDYFVIEYAGNGVLYLPTEQADLITAYMGGEGSPRLNVLGGAEFSRIKAKVKASLKSMAEELVKLYKERETKKGFKFNADTYLETEFANSFEFEETLDQEMAIKDIYADMESGKLMDRLVCGDVGYGKTEVALRAAFKAVVNGKQVAFLCPTTILSEQHYKTVMARTKDFMVRVEVLNRLKSAAEVKDILDRTLKGEVDILIGTHKILRQNVKFKNLGLLILDEEQRFGVRDKEEIKKYKTDIGVIALSATPIPRTLHMSLSGIRDISILGTPPKERLPIQTHVGEYSDGLLKEVLMREIKRNGISLVLYNRVESIEGFKMQVENLVPEAKIGVAHGQMNQKQLENVINRLYNGEYNVLIATTIIENGIDLPLANTLFITNADRLGLSQLYQLRGRVGRSNRLAYAYITFDGNKVLTQDAYKRLETINEYKELGSGFKIAMRDLEIRGAGNVLGREQHGHMERVGYDMYVKLLEEAMKEEESGVAETLREIKIDIKINAFLSPGYVSDEDERIKLYKNISTIKSEECMKEILALLEDAFGSVPAEVVNLCKIGLIKNLSAKQFVKKVSVCDGKCELELYKTEKVVSDSLNAAMKNFGAGLKLSQSPIVVLDVKELKTPAIVDKLIKFLLDANIFEV